jgi:hypothetical protein
MKHASNITIFVGTELMSILSWDLYHGPINKQMVWVEVWRELNGDIDDEVAQVDSILK